MPSCVEPISDNKPSGQFRDTLDKLASGSREVSVIRKTNGAIPGLIRLQVIRSSKDILKTIPSYQVQDVVRRISVENNVTNKCVQDVAKCGKLQEYLERGNVGMAHQDIGDATATIVPALTNGSPKESEPDTEYFIKCPQCQQGYPGFQALKEHVEIAHPSSPGSTGSSATPHPASLGSPLGDGPHACLHCTSSFASRDELDKHELHHTLNAQVSCKICNKTFANVYRLQRHMISHDESALLRKFKCTDCDKAFKFKHHLKEHVRIHSGEKPFGCTNCGKRFSHSGSYSSHMTSKKCISMSMKFKRGLENPNMPSDSNSSRKRHCAAPFQIKQNLNISQSNNNTFLPIMPKNETAASILASCAPSESAFASMRSGVLPFYMPPGMHLGPPSEMSPYSLPAHLGLLSHILEQLQATSPHRAALSEPIGAISPQHIRATSSLHSDPEDMIEEVVEEDDKHQSSVVEEERELVMDVEEDEVRSGNNESQREEHRRSDSRASPSAGSNSGGRTSLNMILQNVNVSVTKQLLKANMHSLSQESPTGEYRPVESKTPPASHLSIKKEEVDETFSCSRCMSVFNHKTELQQHEKVLCGQMFRKHEGLAAQMAETMTLKAEYIDLHKGGSISGSEDENEYREYIKDEEKPTSESERKVRVRTAISEEQQANLKEYYALNQRPNREEFSRIAERLKLDNRVVQVWFQNNRARERRMHQSQPSLYPDQPLDLSVKKEYMSTISTPSSSPPWSASVAAHSDSNDEVINLSHKSSRSPTPYRQLHPFQLNYRHSNGSSSTYPELRCSPSHVGQDPHVNGLTSNHLVQRLAQPMYRLPNDSLSLIPMDCPLQYKSDLTSSRSPLLGLQLAENMRSSSSSPGSEKLSWKMDDDYRISHQMDLEGKVYAMNAFKTEVEAEGQFICDQCDKAFSKQSSLARHKYEHSGQRPYKCVECPKAFKHKHHLTEHKRLHSGEKPFQCCKCLKRFSHSGSYSQHMNHRYSYCKPYRE